MDLSNQINVIRWYLIASFTVLVYSSYASCSTLNATTDTLFVFYEKVDKNNIRKSGVIHPEKNEYPKDWGRTFNIIIQNHAHIWFQYHNDVPSWSDMIFDYQVVHESFINENDFKDQKWFRNTPKKEIYETFYGDNKVIYLVDGDRVKEGQAVLIRVYFGYPAKE